MQLVSAGFIVRLNYDDRGSANAKGDWQIENDDNHKKSEKTQVHMANLNVIAFQKDQLSPE